MAVYVFDKEAPPWTRPAKRWSAVSLPVC